MNTETQEAPRIIENTIINHICKALRKTSVNPLICTEIGDSLVGSIPWTMGEKKMRRSLHLCKKTKEEHFKRDDPKRENLKSDETLFSNLDCDERITIWLIEDIVKVHDISVDQTDIVDLAAPPKRKNKSTNLPLADPLLLEKMAETINSKFGTEIVL